MPKYKCLDWNNESDPIDQQSELVGCGYVFEANQDDEGLIDCPNCGMWFNPDREPKVKVETRRNWSNDSQLR